MASSDGKKGEANRLSFFCAIYSVEKKFGSVEK